MFKSIGLHAQNVITNLGNIKRGGGGLERVLYDHFYEHENLHFDILEVGWIDRKSNHLTPIYLMFTEICYNSLNRLHQHG
jgi:hypothetical protein